MTDYLSPFNPEDFPKNAVELVDPSATLPVGIVRGAIYRYSGITGPSLYIGAWTEVGPIILISLKDGNRWTDSPDGNVPDDFTRVVTGADITIKVGG